MIENVGLDQHWFDITRSCGSAVKPRPRPKSTVESIRDEICIHLLTQHNIYMNLFPDVPHSRNI